MAKIDLDDLERTARAADKQAPGICYSTEVREGAPHGSAVAAHMEALDPAMTLSLIRYIRQLEALARRGVEAMQDLHDELQLQKGGEPHTEEIDAGRALLEAGATAYGSWDEHGNWDVDRPAGEPK